MTEEGQRNSLVEKRGLPACEQEDATLDSYRMSLELKQGKESGCVGGGAECGGGPRKISWAVYERNSSTVTVVNF